MTSPDQPTPDKTHGAGIAGYYQNADPGVIGAQNNSWFNQLISVFQNNLINGLLGGFLSVPAAIMSGIGSISEAITGQLGAGLGDVRSTIQDLQDTTTDLSLATGHATAYMSSSPGTTTTSTRMPFTSQSGTIRGVTNLADGRWRLDSAGEWDLSAQVEFWGGLLMPPETFLEILVRDPSGGVYDGITAIADSNKNITVTNVTSTVVPEPGYTVEVRAWTGGIPVVGGSFRGIRGGYGTTRLRIRKFEMLQEAP